MNPDLDEIEEQFFYICLLGMKGIRNYSDIADYNGVKEYFSYL